MSTTSRPDDDVLADLNCREFSRLLSRVGGSGSMIEERDGILLCASSVEFPVLFNIAWRIEKRLDPSHFVERCDAWFANRGRGRGWSVMVRDDGTDDDLADG